MGKKYDSVGEYRDEVVEAICTGPVQGGEYIMGTAIAVQHIYNSISIGLDEAVESIGGCPKFLAQPIARALDAMAYATSMIYKLANELGNSGYESWEGCAQMEEAVARRIAVGAKLPEGVNATGMLDEDGIKESLRKVNKDKAPHVIDRRLFLEHIEALIKEIRDDEALTPGQVLSLDKALRAVEAVRREHE